MALNTEVNFKITNICTYNGDRYLSKTYIMKIY